MNPQFTMHSNAADTDRRPSRNVSSRQEKILSLGMSGVQVRVMEYGDGASGRRPLVILNSIDFSMPPSEEFCQRMWRSGLRVIFIERPGFGTSTPLPNVLLQSDQIQKGAASIAEAAMLQEVFRRLGLENFVLLGMGSANSVCYRLAIICPMVSLSIFSNAVFNQNILDVFRPNWFQAMLRQTIQSRAGLQIASFGVKHRLRQNPYSFYDQVLQKSAGDLGYLQRNLGDFERSAALFQQISVDTIEYDLIMSLKPDTLLKDGLFKSTNAVAFSGVETTDHWRSQLDIEAERLGLPVAYAPNGDLYAPYASPEFLLDLISDRLGRAKVA